MNNNKNIRTSLKDKIIQVGPNSEGKLPPQVIELEESVLGGIMLDSSAMRVAIEILKAESFYKDAHLTIYKAMYRLYAKSEPIDLLTVTQELRESGELDHVGGAYYVTQLTTRLTSAANIEFHARIVQEKYLQRSLIKISNESIRGAYEDDVDVFDLIEKHENDIFHLTRDNFSKKESKIGELYLQKLKDIENKKEGEIEGIATGTIIDSVTLGWKKQELIILAARPGMGKTAMVLGWAKNIGIDQNIPVMIYSLEMGELALMSRLMAQVSDIPLRYLINNDVRGVLFEKLMYDLPIVKKAPLYIDDQGGLTVMQLRSKVRRHISQYGIQMIIVDYLQKMRGSNKGQNREQEINEIVSGLKNIAKEFDIPVIALSQLSRDVERRGSKTPELADLRESGSIEQEADSVIFLYRPEYYKLTEDSNGVPIEEGDTEITWAKNRNGPLDTVIQKWIGEYTKFVDKQIHIEETQYVSAEYTPPKSNRIEPPETTNNQTINDDLPF